jgi:hypothetical protein
VDYVVARVVVGFDDGVVEGGVEGGVEGSMEGLVGVFGGADMQMGRGCCWIGCFGHGLVLVVLAVLLVLSVLVVLSVLSVVGVELVHNARVHRLPWLRKWFWR